MVKYTVCHITVLRQSVSPPLVSKDKPGCLQATSAEHHEMLLMTVKLIWPILYLDLHPILRNRHSKSLWCVETLRQRPEFHAWWVLKYMYFICVSKKKKSCWGRGVTAMSHSHTFFCLWCHVVWTERHREPVSLFSYSVKKYVQISRGKPLKSQRSYPQIPALEILNCSFSCPGTYCLDFLTF